MHEQLRGDATWTPPTGLRPEHPQRWWRQQSWRPVGGQPAQYRGHGPEKTLAFWWPLVERLRAWARRVVPHPGLRRTAWGPGAGAQHPWTGQRCRAASATLPQLLLQVRPTFPRWGEEALGQGLSLLKVKP